MKYTLKVENLTLAMWESTPIAENQKGTDGKDIKGADGKKVKTGKMIDYTTYHFKNDLGEVEKIMSLQSKWRELEHKEVTVLYTVSRSEFQGKTECKLSLLDVTES